MGVMVIYQDKQPIDDLMSARRAAVLVRATMVNE
jgi:hypothetical protein